MGTDIQPAQPPHCVFLCFCQQEIPCRTTSGKPWEAFYTDETWVLSEVSLVEEQTGSSLRDIECDTGNVQITREQLGRLPYVRCHSCFCGLEGSPLPRCFSYSQCCRSGAAGQWEVGDFTAAQAQSLQGQTALMEPDGASTRKLSNGGRFTSCETTFLRQ